MLGGFPARGHFGGAVGQLPGPGGIAGGPGNFTQQQHPFRVEGAFLQGAEG